nr:hypothetical protein [Halogranum amylolyticum]
MANAQLVAAAPEVELLEYPVFERDPLLTSHVDRDPGMYPFDLAFDLIESEPTSMMASSRSRTDPGSAST